MDPVLLAVLNQLLASDAMQPVIDTVLEAVAEPVGDAIAASLPDVTEDVVATFLRRVADHLEAANP